MNCWPPSRRGHRDATDEAIMRRDCRQKAPRLSPHCCAGIVAGRWRPRGGGQTAGHFRDDLVSSASRAAGEQHRMRPLRRKFSCFFRRAHSWQGRIPVLSAAFSSRALCRLAGSIPTESGGRIVYKSFGDHQLCPVDVRQPPPRRPVYRTRPKQACYLSAGHC